MQVVEPIDIADALRVDLSRIFGKLRFFCIPIPPDLQAGDVVIEQLGGSSVSGSSSVYDVTLGAYATTEEDAVSYANQIYGALVSLPIRDTLTQYSEASANLPYSDHDPRAPQLARQSFRAQIICPGKKLNL